MATAKRSTPQDFEIAVVIGERLARLEEKMDNSKASMDELKAQIHRLEQHKEEELQALSKRLDDASERLMARVSDLERSDAHFKGESAAAKFILPMVVSAVVYALGWFGQYLFKH